MSANKLTFLNELRDGAALVVDYANCSGMLLFYGSDSLLDWACWLLSDYCQEVADEQILGLRKALKDEAVPAIERVRRVLTQYNAIERSSLFAVSFQLFTYSELLSDPDIRELFIEYLDENNLPQCEPSDNLPELESAICEKFGELEYGWGQIRTC